MAQRRRLRTLEEQERDLLIQSSSLFLPSSLSSPSPPPSITENIKDDDEEPALITFRRKKKKIIIDDDEEDLKDQSSLEEKETEFFESLLPPNKKKKKKIIIDDDDDEDDINPPMTMDEQDEDDKKNKEEDKKDRKETKEKRENWVIALQRSEAEKRRQLLDQRYQIEKEIEAKLHIGEDKVYWIPSEYLSSYDGMINSRWRGYQAFQEAWLASLAQRYKHLFWVPGGSLYVKLHQQRNSSRYEVKEHNLDSLLQHIKQAIDVKKTFITIYIQLTAQRGSSHANMVIINVQNYSLFAMDPHGYKPHFEETLFPLLAKYLTLSLLATSSSSSSPAQLLIPREKMYTYQHKSGPQNREGISTYHIQYLWKGLDGKCALWCLFVIHMILDHHRILGFKSSFYDIEQQLTTMEPNVASYLIQRYTTHVVRQFHDPSSFARQYFIKYNKDAESDSDYQPVLGILVDKKVEKKDKKEKKSKRDEDEDEARIIHSNQKRTVESQLKFHIDDSRQPETYYLFCTIKDTFQTLTKELSRLYSLAGRSWELETQREGIDLFFPSNFPLKIMDLTWSLGLFWSTGEDVRCTVHSLPAVAKEAEDNNNNNTLKFKVRRLQWFIPKLQRVTPVTIKLTSTGQEFLQENWSRALIKQARTRNIWTSHGPDMQQVIKKQSNPYILNPLKTLFADPRLVKQIINPKTDNMSVQFYVRPPKKIQYTTQPFFAVAWGLLMKNIQNLDEDDWEDFPLTHQYLSSSSSSSSSSSIKKEKKQEKKEKKEKKEGKESKQQQRKYADQLVLTTLRILKEVSTLLKRHNSIPSVVVKGSGKLKKAFMSEMEQMKDEEKEKESKKIESARTVLIPKTHFWSHFRRITGTLLDDFYRQPHRGLYYANGAYWFRQLEVVTAMPKRGNKKSVSVVLVEFSKEDVVEVSSKLL